MRHQLSSPRRARSIRWSGLAAIVAGVVIAVTPFALSLFRDAPSGQRVLDRFRTTLSVQGLAALKNGYTTVEGMSDQFLTEALPGVQRQLHESPAAFQADLAAHYPAIATAEKTIPPVFALVTPKVPALLGLHEDFQKVDSLPFLGLPVSSVPWLLLGVGLGVSALGLLVMTRPSVARGALVAIVGLGLIAVPLALSIPSKADAGVQLQRAGTFVFSPKVAPAALLTTQRAARMVTEIETTFVPQIAARMHESPAQFTAQLDRRYPAVARGLAAWPSLLPGGLQRAREQVASVPDAARIDGVDVRAVPWLVIAPGILMLCAGLLALAIPMTPPRRNEGVTLPEPEGVEVGA